MKKQSGISIITLIVTIMVMLILIGIVGAYSLENIKKSNKAVANREFSNVRDFVLTRQASIFLDDSELPFEEYDDLLLTPELAYIVADEKLSASEINTILDVNSSDLETKYKYFYLQSAGKYFEDPGFTKGGMTLKDIKNDYILNFYTGTVICLSDEFFRVEGIIKGLGEINSELDS